MAILKSGAEVSRRMKQELKEKFGKEVKFSVRYSSFSGGDSIDVRWDFGPTVDQVEAIINKYQYGYFDSQAEMYEYDETKVVTPEGKLEELGGVKYVSASRDYRTEAERNSKNWNDEFYNTEKSFQMLIAKDLVLANGGEWKGPNTPIFKNDNNHDSFAHNMAYRVLVDNEFDTSDVKEYSGLLRIKDMAINWGKATYNEESRGFDYGNKYPFHPDFRNQFAIKYDGKASTPVRLIEEVREQISRKEHRDAEEAEQKKRQETHNMQLSQLKHIVNGSNFSDAVRHLAQIAIYEMDYKEVESDIKNIGLKRFELINPVIIKAEFPNLDDLGSLAEVTKYITQDKVEKPKEPVNVKIDQVIVVNNVNYALLGNCLQCALPDIWKGIGGITLEDEIIEKELGYNKDQLADFDKRLIFFNLTPEEKSLWYAKSYSHGTLVFNDETKEAFIARSSSRGDAHYVGYPVNSEEIEKAMLAIKVDVPKPQKLTLLDLNLTPSEFFSRLDLTKMDAETASAVTKLLNSDTFRHIDNEELTPDIKKFSEYVYAAYPEALGLPEDIDYEEVAKQADISAQKIAAEKIQKLETRLELVKEMLSAKPKDKKLRARIELITEMIESAKSGLNMTNGGTIREYDINELNAMDKGQLNDIYKEKYHINALHQDYNTLVAALYYGKRIKYVTEEEQQAIKGKMGNGGLIYLYKEGNKITVDGHVGTIKTKGTSTADNNTFPSYWVVFDDLHKDGQARNVWETSIDGALKEGDMFEDRDGNEFTIKQIGKDKITLTGEKGDKEIWQQSIGFYKRVNKMVNGGYLDADRHGALIIKESIIKTLGNLADTVTYVGNNKYEIVFNPEIKINEIQDILDNINEITLDDKNFTIFETSGCSGDGQLVNGKPTISVTYTVDEMSEGGNVGNDLDKLAIEYILGHPITLYHREANNIAYKTSKTPIWHTISTAEVDEVIKHHKASLLMSGGLPFIFDNEIIIRKAGNTVMGPMAHKIMFNKSVYEKIQEDLKDYTGNNKYFMYEIDGILRAAQPTITGAVKFMKPNLVLVYLEENEKFEKGGPIKERFISLAPDGTVFVRFGSHRTSDKVKRAEIPQISFYNFYTSGSAGQSLHLINEQDFKKIEGITGVSGPYKKLTSPGMKWAARVGDNYHSNAKIKALYDAYYNLNDEYAHLDKKSAGGEFKSTLFPPP